MASPRLSRFWLFRFMVFLFVVIGGSGASVEPATVKVISDLKDSIVQKMGWKPEEVKIYNSVSSRGSVLFPIYEQRRSANVQVPFHAFGFGVEHDAATMHSISEETGGTFLRKRGPVDGGVELFIPRNRASYTLDEFMANLSQEQFPDSGWCGPPPASRSAVDAMLTVKIAEKHLCIESHYVVCIDEFEIGGRGEGDAV